MARLIPKRDDPAQTAGSATPDNPNPAFGKNGTYVERAGSADMGEALIPGVRGGAFGILPEAVQRIQQGAVRPVVDGQQVGKQAKRYMLTEDWRVVINGQVIPTKKGKIYLDTAYDIANLMVQGVPLQCLDPDPPPLPAAEPEQSAV
jgi:hypothetical protein